MNYLKKQINLKKTINFFSEYKIILSFQYNNLTVKEWCDFKLKLQKLKKIGILFTKNTLMKKVQESTKLTNTIKYNNKLNSTLKHDIIVENNIKKNFFFQGPSVIVGCETIEELEYIFNLIKSSPNIILLGGWLETQPLTHLDLTKLLQVNTSSYNRLISLFANTTTFHDILNQHLKFHTFSLPAFSLINCLIILHYKKANQEIN